MTGWLAILLHYGANGTLGPVALTRPCVTVTRQAQPAGTVSRRTQPSGVSSRKAQPSAATSRQGCEDN